MIKLSDTQRAILATAAQRDDLSVLPLPETIKLKGGALKQVMDSLSKRGLIRVVQTDPDRIVITSEGVAAIEPETTDAPEPKDTATKPAPRAGTKQALLIDMLKRPEGATVEQIAAATGWQRHTIRGAISGALKKKLGLNVEATRTREVGPNKNGAKGSTTNYRIIS
ncbi:MAG: DUF3489 domain-containing protein [Nitrospirota bacterium]|nr:DUF3489 domain-containing protein [Nitrospirota bacterium]